MADGRGKMRYLFRWTTFDNIKHAIVRLWNGRYWWIQERGDRITKEIPVEVIGWNVGTGSIFSFMTCKGVIYSFFDYTIFNNKVINCPSVDEIDNGLSGITHALKRMDK
jgi:hypothetical protein